MLCNQFLISWPQLQQAGARWGVAAAGGNTRNWQIKQDSSINDSNNGQLEPTGYLERFDCYILELQTKIREDFTIMLSN